MKPYFQDDAVTIYHGENSCCASVRLVVDCTHENTIRETGIGYDKGATVSGKKGRHRSSEVSTWAGNWKQAVGRVDREAETMGGRSSGMEGRRGEREGWPGACFAPIRAATVFCLRQGSFRAASHRRQHTKQRAREHCICLPQVPHGEGWAS